MGIWAGTAASQGPSPSQSLGGAVLMESGERDGGGEKPQSWLYRWKGARACGYYWEPAQMRLQPPRGSATVLNLCTPLLQVC